MSTPDVDATFFQIIIAAAAGVTLTVLGALGVKFGKKDTSEPLPADARDKLIRELQEKVFSMEIQRRLKDDIALALGAMKTSIDTQLEEISTRLHAVERVLTMKGFDLE